MQRCGSTRLKLVLNSMSKKYKNIRFIDPLRLHVNIANKKPADWRPVTVNQTIYEIWEMLPYDTAAVKIFTDDIKLRLAFHGQRRITDLFKKDNKK